MPYKPKRFISEEVDVHFIQPPVYEKRPGSPDGFTWSDDYYEIVELLSEWFDISRRGRMARNMRPTHVAVAANRGSWGVGQFYFRVRTHDDRIFDLYYDRAPKDAGDRKGSWFLDREMVEVS